ncbi:hypothetical protein LTR93_011822 [Exophiala xenobiotica]|nr:hypothetical protein LTR93_011822 [Exophiala xenobiotica]
MEGVGGLRGWRWIFILEGIVTVLLAIAGYKLVIDFTEKALTSGPLSKKAFLNEEEAEIVLIRIQRDRSDAVADDFSIRNISRALNDYNLWEFCFINLLNNMVAYSYNYFLPIMLQAGMGFSIHMSQLLNFPPYPMAALVRGPLIIRNGLLATLGVCLTAFLTGPAGRYVGVFIGIAACNANVTAILSYQHNNIVGQTKRAAGSALLITGGAIGAIIATNIFRQQDHPNYRQVLNPPK